MRDQKIPRWLLEFQHPRLANTAEYFYTAAALVIVAPSLS